VLTFQEAIDLVNGKAGLYPELKSPEVFRGRGMDMTPAVITALRKNGLDCRQVAQPDVVTWAHEAGLTVTPYTFRAGSTGRFGSVREEMQYFLYTLGVDAVFTDNPDQFPAK